MVVHDRGDGTEAKRWLLFAMRWCRVRTGRLVGLRCRKVATGQSLVELNQASARGCDRMRLDAQTDFVIVVDIAKRAPASCRRESTSSHRVARGPRSRSASSADAVCDALAGSGEASWLGAGSSRGGARVHALMRLDRDIRVGGAERGSDRPPVAVKVH